MKPAEEIVHVRRVARVGEGRTVDRHSERVLYDLGDVLEHVLVALGAGALLGARLGHLRVDDVEGDPGRLVVAQRNEELLPQAAHRLPRDAVLGRVALLHVEREGHADGHVLPRPLEGEGDVVCEGEDEVGAQLVRELVPRAVRDAVGEGEHLHWDPADAGQALDVDVVERGGDLVQRHLAGEPAIADSLAHGDELVPRAVLADGDVVVDAANGLHATRLPRTLVHDPTRTRRTSEARKKLPEANL